MSSTEHEGFALDPHGAARIAWHIRGSCGNAGCPDRQCRCSLCDQPIGVPDFDPRWDSHPEDCAGCDLCEDSVPVILFRGEGKSTEQAQLHWACLRSILVK